MPSKNSTLEMFGGSTEIAKRIISAVSKVEDSGVSADTNVDTFLKQLSKISSEDFGKYLAVNGINLSEIFPYPDSEDIPSSGYSVGVGSDGSNAPQELLDLTFAKMDALNAICSDN